MAQTPVQHYLPELLERIEKGEIDPSFVITHRATLEEGPELYKTFRAKQDGCIKVVMMSGPSREIWEHSISAVEAPRYSITFRTMIEEPDLGAPF